MANISNDVNVHDGAAVTNWISQINAGGAIYDIATHHSITFKDGSGDTKGTTWNGLSDIEVVIPSITDIVQSPVVFAGTVDADGIHGNATHKDVETAPKEGYLVFVTADCSLAGLACEAGDMAIYDGSKWNIVSGENQVTITGTTNKDIEDGNRTVVAVGAAKDVLEVEGKALALTLDYADIMKHTKVSKGDSVEVVFGDVTVAATDIKLVQGDKDTKTISKDVTVTEATALADGTVTFSGAEGLVNGVTFGTFNAGAFPELTKNSEKTLAVTGGSLTASVGEVFVSDVTFGKVTFKPADANDENKITMLTNLTSAAGAEFLNGIALTKEGETADLTIAGTLVPTAGAKATFVEGLTNGSSTVVTGITAGSFELTAGDKLVTGFDDNSTDVIATVTATVNNDTDVFNSATVTGHVLSFGTTKVASGVNVTTTKKNLVKTGFTYTAPTTTDSGFKTSGFTQSADVKYTFGRGNETTYSATPAMWKLETPELNVSKGKYEINHKNMVATVSEGMFYANSTAGTLPSLTQGSVSTATLTGSVGTALTTADKTIRAVADGLNEITLPGAYTLTTAKKGEGDVTVAAAGNTVTASASVNLGGYVTDVVIAQ